jgi:DNA repair exonuclease SbcCD nuclease subunit
MLRVFHTADFHVRDIDYDECEKCLNFIVDQAEAEAPDLIVIAGDLSDSQEIRMKSRSARLLFDIVSHLSTIAPVVIPIGTPTHDGMAPLLFKHINPSRIWVSEVPEQIFLTEAGLTNIRPLSTPMAVISQFPAPTKKHFQSTSNSIEITDAEISEAMAQVFMGFGAGAADYDCPHVLTGHWNVYGAHVSENQILTGKDIEVTQDQISLANADVVCLGHIHMMQQIGKNIYFPGSSYRKDYGELEPKGFFIHEVETGYLKTTPTYIPTRNLVVMGADLTTEKDITVEALAVTDQNMIEAIVRYQIKVYTDEVKTINQAELKRLLEAQGAKSVDIRLARIPRENIRCERLMRLERLTDKFREMAEIKGQPLNNEILDKIDQLETQEPGAILDALDAKIKHIVEIEAVITLSKAA